MLYEIEFKKGIVGHRKYCEYVGDIFIEVELVFNDDGYALECQEWSEEAKSGDRYEDENLIIVCK